MIKNKILTYATKIKKKIMKYIYFIFMIKVRYVCLLKCFFKHIETNK